LSKEFVILDTDIVVAFNSTVATILVWFALGDTVSQDFLEFEKENKEELAPFYDLYVDALKEVAGNLEAAHQRVPFMADVADHVARSHDALVLYQNRKLRHGAYAAIVAKLNAAKAAKDLAGRELRAQILGGMEPYVVDAFQNDEALRAADLRYVSNILGGSDAGEDPLHGVMLQYLDKWGQEQEQQA